MIIKKTTTTILFLFLLTGILFLSGCGNKGIEGTWVLTEEYEADGTKITSKELEEQGVSETYEINGTAVVYTCEMKSMKKPIVINFELEDLGDNKYNFKLNGNVTFASPTVKGNTMTYEVGEGEDYMKMVFKRK